MNFTRSGNFTTNDKGYLITTDGYYVMGKVSTDTAGTGGVADCYIEIPKGATDVAIAPDGAVSFIPPSGYTQPAALPPIGSDGRAIAGYLSVSTFQNTPACSASRTTAGWRPPSPAPSRPARPRPVRPGDRGVLEMSNVDMASEFTTMISAQRGFQATRASSRRPTRCSRTL